MFLNLQYLDIFNSGIFLFIIGNLSLLGILGISIILLAGRKQIIDTAHKIVTGIAASAVVYEKVLKPSGSSSNDDDKEEDKNKKKGR